jgi:cysteine-rich repeat protein
MGEALAIPVVAGETVFVFVDGTSGVQSGVFELHATLFEPVCGNGTLEGAEACDDGNALAGDGCSETCEIEPAGVEDACPGEPIVLVDGGAGFAGSVYSGLANLNEDETAIQCASGGRDAVYSFVAPVAGVAVATVDAPFSASVYARSACSDAASQLDCGGDGGGVETASFPVVAGGTYFLFVDAETVPAVGPFWLEVEVSPPQCGDGFVNGADECDDANAMGGDGCSVTCSIEGVGANDACPGLVLVLSDPDPNVPRSATVTTDTTSLSANVVGSCGGGGRDAVYAVTSDVTGLLEAELVVAPGLDAVLHARASCGDVATELDCDDAPLGGITASFPVTAGVTTYLFVDGLSGELGVSTLTIQVTP